MKPASLKIIKDEIKHLSQPALVELCLRLIKFKSENKELLSYLLFDADNEEDYILRVKTYIDESFLTINKKSNYLIKKGIRKILQHTKKYIKYSTHKETEVVLLIHFCKKTKASNPPMKHNKRVQNMYNTQVKLIQNRVATLHEDLQYDYQDIIRELVDDVRL